MPDTKTARLSARTLACGVGAALGIGICAGMAATPGAPVNATPQAAPAVGRPQSFADIVQRVAPAVVSIDVEGKVERSPVSLPGPLGIPGPGDDGQDGQGDEGLPPGFDLRQFFGQQFGQHQGPQSVPVAGTGSGFFISPDGYILTNNHVVEHADKITVRTKDGHAYPARLIGRDPATDLAVVKINEGNDPYVTFEDSAKPRVGDWVVALGNPYNLGGTATAGIISALGRQNVSGSSYVDYMQIDAPINKGNSGGPTFDVYGRVVGVNSAIFSPSGGSVGIGFDIPAEVAARVSHELIADGTVRRGYIGAQIQNVTADLAASMGTHSTAGALVADVTPGGPAERAGLRSGDLVRQVDGHDVASAADLTRRVGQAGPGANLRLLVARDGAQQTIILRTGLRPNEQALAKNDQGQAAPDGQVESSLLGMRLVPNDGGGVTIADIASGSDAADKGLRPGDVILKSGAVNATTPSDVRAGVAQARREGRKDVLMLVSRNGHRLFVPLSTQTGGSANG